MQLQNQPNQLFFKETVNNWLNLSPNDSIIFNSVITIASKLKDHIWLDEIKMKILSLNDLHPYKKSLANQVSNEIDNLKSFARVLFF